MASNSVDKTFSIQVPYNDQLIAVDVLPFYTSSRLVYRIITANFPELVIGLNSFDNWEEIGGQGLIASALLYTIGERIDHYLL